MLVADVEFLTEIMLVVLLPLLVTDCRVLVFQMVMLPVLVLTAVSVPAIILVWLAYWLTVAVVNTC